MNEPVYEWGVYVGKTLWGLCDCEESARALKAFLARTKGFVWCARVADVTF